MDKRSKFALAAMQALIGFTESHDCLGGDENVERVRDAAYRYADAMLSPAPVRLGQWQPSALEVPPRVQRFAVGDYVRAERGINCEGSFQGTIVGILAGTQHERLSILTEAGPTYAALGCHCKPYPRPQPAHVCQGEPWGLRGPKVDDIVECPDGRLGFIVSVGDFGRCEVSVDDNEPNVFWARDALRFVRPAGQPPEGAPAPKRRKVGPRPFKVGDLGRPTDEEI